MVTGIITWIAIGVVITFIEITLFRIVKFQAYNQGMQEEAQQWVNAIQKIKVPNWQSLPPTDFGMQDPERAKLAAQVYVVAYQCCLDVIKEEIAMNRIEAMADQLNALVVEGTEDNTRFPIA
jgi:hypothetical protein